MAIDQQGGSQTVLLCAMARQMDFAHSAHGQLLYISNGIAAMVLCADPGIVDIQQQTAAGAVQHFTDEVGLAVFGLHK